MPNSSRRTFIKVSGFAAAAATISMPASAAISGANDRIRFGVIGCGGMGTGHVHSLVKRSEADNIKVELTYGIDHLSISVTDDGIGFQPNLVPANEIGHFGLRSMRTRASKIGGDLKITSEPNHGTSILITVPTNHPKGSPSHAGNNHG